MGDLNRLYAPGRSGDGEYLSLSWKGRVRYTVPRSKAAQQTCWRVFRPGLLQLPLRALARSPQWLRSTICVEGPHIETIRRAVSTGAGYSCCRSGAAGPWSKDTILFLDESATRPAFFVKAGCGAAIGSLLQNEASWLTRLSEHAGLSDNVPELLAHRPGAELSFVAQLPLAGRIDFEFGRPHINFLQKLHSLSCRSMHFKETRLCQNLRSRLEGLSGLLSEAWSARLTLGMRTVEESLAGKRGLFVAAHNDFTPWNTRLERGVARVFDWEYADVEHFPLFDPIHFQLLPLGLKGQPTAKMAGAIAQTIKRCTTWSATELCKEAETQALAYLLNLSTLYLHAEKGRVEGNIVLGSYGRLIDHLCRTSRS